MADANCRRSIEPDSAAGKPCRAVVSSPWAAHGLPLRLSAVAPARRSISRSRRRLFGQRIALRQLMRVPGRQPMTNRLFAHLFLRHRGDHFVVNEQPIDIQRLVARRVGRFEFDCLAAFRIFDAGQQRSFE